MGAASEPSKDVDVNIHHLLQAIFRRRNWIYLWTLIMLAAAGLMCVADMGEWWERASGMPIPLGAILVRHDVPEDEARAINDAIRRSLAFARNDEAAIIPFVREHAFEMDDEVMRKHIGLYVNEFSDDLGKEGIAAVTELFARARAAKIIPEGSQARFVSE